jgi:hypothetical protein
VICRQDLNDGEPLSTSFVPGEDLNAWTYKDLAKEWTSLYPLPPITVVVGDQNTAASKWNWWRALSLASRDVRPPDEHLFVRDALGAVRRDNGRRAVLDAATAAELVLTAGLQGKYGQASKPNFSICCSTVERWAGARTWRRN